MSSSLRLHGLYSLWNSPGQNTGVGSLSLLQGIFPTQGLNPGLLHCRQILCQLRQTQIVVLKSRDITLPTKVCIVKALVFPVVTYGCESQTLKKSEHRGTDAFELSCWRRLLRVPWTARRSNQSILKEISPEYLLKGLMLKLKLQSFGHMM